MSFDSPRGRYTMESSKLTRRLKSGLIDELLTAVDIEALQISRINHGAETWTAPTKSYNQHVQNGRTHSSFGISRRRSGNSVTKVSQLFSFIIIVFSPFPFPGAVSATGAEVLCSIIPQPL